jgi:hypothetical protein
VSGQIGIAAAGMSVPGKIAFCTTCKNRTGHLRKTLPQNLLDNPKSKFIVLDYNSEDDLITWLKNDMSQCVKEGKIVVYSYRDYPKFRMAHAKNLAHRLGMLEGADILVNLDADNFAGEGFEDFIEQHFASHPKTLLWARMVKGEMTRGISGRIAVSASAFHKVGGYDEAKYAEWGSDDKDFNLRLQSAGYEPAEIPRQFLNSIPHNSRMRFKEYPHLNSKEHDYFHVNKSEIKNAVVNGAQIGRGRVFRNFDETRGVEIGPLATRVFGIGLHKTATTSLHRAMEALGYDSWHWNSAHSAKAIWQEMNNNGYSKILERYHAASDLPVPLLFRQLDKAYPGSKFVLTVRAVNTWMDALRRHYSYYNNQFRHAWDSDPFTHRVHKLLYGTSHFDEMRMARRFAHHVAEVTGYFQDRPHDLFIFNPAYGDGWDDLCGFLGIGRPSIPFPRAYVKQDHDHSFGPRSACARDVLGSLMGAEAGDVKAGIRSKPTFERNSTCSDGKIVL